MKFLQVYTFYPVYLEHRFGGSIPGADSDSVLRFLREDRFLASHDWARELEQRGWDARWWVANCRPAVDAYRREHGLGQAATTEDENATLAHLIEEFRPDVLFVGNPVRFDGRFLASLKFRPRLIVGWMAAPFPPEIDWRGFDLLLSHLTTCRAGALRQGVRRVERFHPGFPLEIWDRFGSARPECDVVFSGQWTSDHARRNALFHQLARAADLPANRMDVRFHFAPHASRLPPEIERRDHGARWGLDMFKALRSGRISLNAEIDMASGEAGNMRLFEATGMGSMLLTEHQPNIDAFFEPGREIETFRNSDEMLEKIRWYLAHPVELEAVAEAGRRACHERFPCSDRARVLEGILLENHAMLGGDHAGSRVRSHVVSVEGSHRRDLAGKTLVVIGRNANASDAEASSDSVVARCGSGGDFGGDADFIVDKDGETDPGEGVLARGENDLCAALELACRLHPKEVVLRGFGSPRMGFEGCDTSALRQLHSLRRRLEAEAIAVFDASDRPEDGPFTRLRAIAKGCAEAMGTIHGTILERLRVAGREEVVHILGIDGWQDWSGDALRDRILRWADLFSSECGVGEMVLFSKRLDVDLLAGYLGAMAAGCIPAQASPESPKIPPAEQVRKMRHVLSLTGARTIFCDADAPAELTGTGRVVRPGDIPRKASGRCRSNPSGICLAQFSSGTTGLQKAVFLSHSAIEAHMAAYAPSIGLGKGDTVVSWLPLYHDMGLMAAYLMPLHQGVPLAIMDPFAWIARPELLGEAAEKYSGTLAFLPNFAYHVLARARRHAGIGRFRLFVNCSEPARPDTHSLFREAYPEVGAERLSVCYAMAENSFAVSQTEPGSVPRILELGGRRLLSCGAILPGTEVRVLEPDADGVGELAIRGGSLFSRFLDGVDRTVDGWYPTGDLGKVDGGEVFVAGRKKDLLIVHGKNVHPQDVEHVAGNCHGVHPGRAVCFGVESAGTGSEEMVVLFEPSGGSEPADARLQVAKAVEDETGILPRVVLVVPKGSLVKTSSGKMSRVRNKELYLQGTWGSHPC